MEGRFDNITIVWEELDRHYGAPKIVTAEVLVELQELERKRDKHDFIPTFATMLEDAARLLDAIDQGERVKSEPQVEHWVGMLPDAKQDRYFMEYKSLSGSDWEKLMKFLTGRKRTIQENLICKEYVTSPGRGKVENKADTPCVYPRCGKTGHTIDKCGLYKSDQTRLAKGTSGGPSGGAPFRRKCDDCGEFGHRKYFCPNRGRGRSSSEGDVEGIGQGQLSSHYLTTNSCRERGRCSRVMTKDVKGLGCQEFTKAGERLSHCIFHCGVYRRAGVDQKSKIANRW